MSGRVYLYDTTLRDGAQTQGVDFNTADKMAIAQALDRLGIDYIEGGWPGANPTDDAFFEAPPRLDRAVFTAFGMTRRAGRSAGNDPGFRAVVDSKAAASCLVGKSWDFHVTTALGTTLEDNLDAIGESIAAAVERGEALFDAEHFFDGWKANRDYALACVTKAHQAGARWIVLCDTNGGTLPDEIEEIVRTVSAHIPGDQLGIHCHDDTGNAIANSLAAVRAGARMVQGTLNGLGERCGNADLIAIIPNLMLKMGYQTGIAPEKLHLLTHTSRMLDDRLNRPSRRGAPYVGESAFAHKGGLHVSAMAKDPRSYEHIDPALVGNSRTIVVSDQAGRSNILARFRDIGLEMDASDSRVASLLDLVKRREHEGFAYDGAEASFELLARQALGEVPRYFRMVQFRVTDERRANPQGEMLAMSEAVVKVAVEGRVDMCVAEGNGPVNALDIALRQALEPVYPELRGVRLVDYKVRILNSADGTRATTRVMIESEDAAGERWATVGVSPNIIEASYRALDDSLTWRLVRQDAAVKLHAAA